MSQEEESLLQFYKELFDQISYYEIQEEEVIRSSMDKLRQFLEELKTSFQVNMDFCINASFFNGLHLICGVYDWENTKKFQSFLLDFRKESLVAKRLTSHLLKTLYRVAQKKEYYYLSTIYSCFCDLFVFQQRQSEFFTFSWQNASLFSFSEIQGTSPEWEVLDQVQKKLGTIPKFK